MAGANALDVLIVSLGSTSGLRAADEELAQSLRRAGASVAIAAARPPRPLRTLALTDLGWARAARGAAEAELARRTVAAVIYSSTTAALLWPRPGAIRFDAPSARATGPGAMGSGSGPLERRRLRQASLLLPWSEGGLAEAPAAARRRDRALVLPVSVQSTNEAGSAGDGRGAPVSAHETSPRSPTPPTPPRRVSTACWRPGGACAPSVRRGRRRSSSSQAPRRSSCTRPGSWLGGEPGIRVVGMLAAGDYRALLRRARVFACAPRREDYGIAQLEALADGCLLVTTPAPGPYAALGDRSRARPATRRR